MTAAARRPGLTAVGAALGAALLALSQADRAGVAGPAAVDDVVRVAIPALALFAACGYAPARLLVTGAPRAHLALFVLPLGAACCTLALTVLGLLHVPLRASLAVVAALGLAAAAWSHTRAAPVPAAPPADARRHAAVLRVVLPLVLAALVAAVSLLPIFRAGFATVPGQNGDAILVVGTAELLEHAPPTATRPELPLDRVPLVWRSKYPIYYGLAAVSTLSGRDPIQSFAPVSAVVFALAALGIFLFAWHTLGAGLLASSLALFLVPFDRISTYVAIHPYYNQLWGLFTLPFILLFGTRLLREPDRRSFALFALFATLGLLAYPLMLPLPAVFLGVLAWRARRERELTLRLPRPRLRPWAWIPLALLALPVVAVLVRGFLEKTLSAAAVLAPWTDLGGWSGSALPYLPVGRFFGIDGPAGVIAVAVPAVFAAAWWGVRRSRPEARAPLYAFAAAGVFIAAYFRARGQGQLFWFKDLAFLGPVVVTLAIVGLVALARERALPAWARRAAAAGLALYAVVLMDGARAEIAQTFDQANPAVLELREWSARLPRDASIRIDVPPSGFQLWAAYMLHEHPLSAKSPLTSFFPHPPRGRKADYVLAQRAQPVPADAAGPALLANGQFLLWRMRRGVPGPDLSSRTLEEAVTQITF